MASRRAGDRKSKQQAQIVVAKCQVCKHIPEDQKMESGRSPMTPTGHADSLPSCESVLLGVEAYGAVGSRHNSALTDGHKIFSNSARTLIVTTSSVNFPFCCKDCQEVAKNCYDFEAALHVPFDSPFWGISPGIIPGWHQTKIHKSCPRCCQLPLSPHQNLQCESRRKHWNFSLLNDEGFRGACYATMLSEAAIRSNPASFLPPIIGSHDAFERVTRSNAW